MKKLVFDPFPHSHEKNCARLAAFPWGHKVDMRTPLAIVFGGGQAYVVGRVGVPQWKFRLYFCQNDSVGRPACAGGLECGD
jgi:hypothetical protein